MKPSQKKDNPKYSSMGQVVLTQPNLVDNITKFLPNKWSMKGGKKLYKKKGRQY